MSFRTHLRGNVTLDASGKRSISLQQQLRGYKYVYPPIKNHMAIPAKLVFHIYKREYSHLSTTIRNLTAGPFFFGIRSCKYYTTPKGCHKQTRVLRKGFIKFYRKRGEVPHSIGRLHLADKVSPTFRTQNIVTQWRRRKNICPVQV